MMKATRMLFNGLRTACTRQICMPPGPVIGINGFGRIGKSLLRLAMKRKNVNVVAVNEPNADVNDIARSFRQDTIHGPYNGQVLVSNNCLHIDGKTVKVFHEKNPEDIKWGSVAADYIIDSTGEFTGVKDAAKHLTQNGAKKVIISAPSKDAPMFVRGVNFDAYKSTMNVVSNASCTTNCAAPLIHLMHQKFGVENCLLTTTHAMTATQAVHDGLIYRSASGNIIPSATGAAKAVGEVIPELKGKIDGDSIRVPTMNVSLLKLYMNVKTDDVDAEAVKCQIWKNVHCFQKGLTSYYDVPDKYVSSDFIGSEYSAIVDFSQIECIGRFVSLAAWYDNEMGYSSRVLDLVRHMFKVDNDRCCPGPV